MYLNLMRYRTGKFGIKLTESTKQGKRINNDYIIGQCKREFGERCTEYRVENKNGIDHIWTFRTITAVTTALEFIQFPSTDNEEV